MILFLNTAEFNRQTFALIAEKIVKKQTTRIKHHESEKTLSAIKRFLGKDKLKGIDKIIVVSGPGSFTGIRVGIAIALAFSFARSISAVAITKSQIPKKLLDLKYIKGKKIFSNFDIDYGAEPNIT